jgi:hypothetical protein
VLFMALGGALAYGMSSNEAAAFNISFSQTCYGDKADVTFRWQGTNPSSQQWLDLSLFDNGWRDGTFIGVGPLPGSDSSFTWQGVVGSLP